MGKEAEVTAEATEVLMVVGMEEVAMVAALGEEMEVVVMGEG